MNNSASKYLQEAFRLGLELEKLPESYSKIPELAMDALAAAETAVLYARQCYEPLCPKGKRKDSVVLLPDENVTGTVSLSKDGWLTLRLDTLLSNNRRPATGYLESSLIQMLKGYQKNKGPLPWYPRAFVVLTEHSSREGGNVYDPDNKEWKGVTNALKGAVFEDDDQFTVSLILDAVWDDKVYCEIIVLPYEDISLYFLRRGKMTR